MENNNNIIDFEEKFKNNDNNEEPKIYEEHSSSLATIFIYLFLFLFGGAAIIATIFFKLPSNTYLVLEQLELSENENVIAVVLKNEFEDDKLDFSFNDFVYEYNDEVILISLNENSEFIDNNKEEIISGEITTWDLSEDDEDNDEKIIILYNEDSKVVNNLLKDKNINYVYLNSNFSISQNGIIMFLAYLIVSVPLIIINRNKLKYDFINFKNDQKKPALSNLAYSFATMFAVSIALGFLSNILILIFKLKPDSVNQQSIELMLASKSFLFIAFTTVFLGPLVEELVFRSAIFSVIKKEKTAIIVSTATFGFIHIMSELIGLFNNFGLMSILEVIVTAIPYVGMGLFLSYLYVKNNKNVFLLFAVHALSNLVSVLLLLVS